MTEDVRTKLDRLEKDIQKFGKLKQRMELIICFLIGVIIVMIIGR